MRRLLAALLLVASPALAQSNGWREIQNGWGEIQTPPGYSTIPAPSGCVSTSVPFFGADLKLTCGVFTDNPATGTISAPTVVAKNITATGLATPGAITVTPVLQQVGTINVVAGASLVDGDYFTIDYSGGTIPIEFDATPGDGTTGGKIPYVFAPGDSAGTIRDGLIALINLAAPTAVVASIGGAAAITVTRIPTGTAGGTITENVANAGFTVAGFADPTHATTVTYKLVAKLADGTTTEAGAASSTAVSVATLTAANFNRLSWSAVTGATSYAVYRTVAPTSPATTGIIYTGTALTVDDTGLAGGGETAPTVDGTGVVRADRVLVGDGSSGAPSVAFAGYPATGFRLPSANAIQVIVNGNPGLFFNNATSIGLPSTSYFGWSSAADPSGAGSDLIFGRRAAANFRQGGVDAAAPIAQTSSVQGVAVGTADTSGAARTYTGSVSTGAGAGGPLVDQTTYPGAAPTAQNAFASRRYVSSGWTPLTGGAATAIATLTYPASTIVGADFLITIHAADASNNQGITYRVRVNSVRDAAGNTQSTVGIVDDSATLPVAAGSGTLTSTFSVTEGATTATLKATAASSLTETTLRATFQSVANGAGLVVAPVGF